MANIVSSSITSSSTPSSSTSSPSRRGSRIMSSSPSTNIVRVESEIAAPVTAVATPSSPVAPSPTAAAAAATTTSEQLVALVASPSSSSLVATDESSDNGNGSIGNAGNKPAWSKPSNGAVEAGSFMGADSWPALSESARASGKPAQDSSKGLSDGSSSVSSPQGTVSASSISEKPNANTNSTPKHAMPGGQRSIKRNAGISSNSGAPQPTGSQPQTGDMLLYNPSHRDHVQRNSQSRSSNDHLQMQRNSFRRNAGPHSRDGSHHHSYRGRRDQDRTNQDWNARRYFNSRGAHMQPHMFVPSFISHPPQLSPPPTSAPFIGPLPVRAFGNPIGFTELGSPVYYVASPSPEPLRAVPFNAPIPPYPMYFPASDYQLHSKIVNQIEYYFSNENLIRDTFLRQNMDDQGWVPIKLIAGFNKVSQLTDNIQLILDSIRNSSVVEVEGDKVRRHNDWMRWVMPPSVQFQSVSGPPSIGRPSHDILAAKIQSISLEENATVHISGRSQADTHSEAFFGRSSSGDLNSQSHISSTEVTGQVGAQGASDSSVSARNSSK